MREIPTKPGYRLDCQRSGLARETAAALGVFVLFLNVLAASLSHSHFGGGPTIALSADGGKMAICSGARMLFVDKDGNIVPGGDEPRRQGHKCDCCLSMQANAVLPPPQATVAPLEITAIQTLSPGLAARLDAAQVPTRRNRDPPLQA